MSGPTLSDQPHMPMLKAAADAAQDYVAQLRDHLDEVRAELATAEAKLSQQEPVVEAAKAWLQAQRDLAAYDGETHDDWYAREHADIAAHHALQAAVDALAATQPTEGGA